jgi:hypothetical protein
MQGVNDQLLRLLQNSGSKISASAWNGEFLIAMTRFASNSQTATLRCGRIEYSDRPIVTLRRNGPTARQTHAGLIPACGAVGKVPAPFKSKCQYWSVKTRDEVERRAEHLCKYSKVSFCDGSFYDDSLLRPLSSRTEHSDLWCIAVATHASFLCLVRF